MRHGILHQIAQDLFNEDGVHGDHQKFIRNRHGDLHTRAALAEFLQYLSYDLLSSLILLVNVGLGIPHAGDREEIFHHADEPLGFAAGIFQKAALLFRGEKFFSFQNGGGGADDGGQRCADIMRHRAEQVCPGLFFFRFCTQVFLPLDLGGHGAGHHGDHQHHDEGEGISRDGEVKCKVGICKNIVHTDNANEGGDRTKEIAVGQAGDQHNCQHKDHGHKFAIAIHLAQKGTDHDGAKQDHQSHLQIPPGKGKPSGEFFFQKSTSFPEVKDTYFQYDYTR